MQWKNVKESMAFSCRHSMVIMDPLSFDLILHLNGADREIKMVRVLTPHSAHAIGIIGALLPWSKCRHHFQKQFRPK